VTGCKWKRETEDTEIPENFYGIQTTPHLDSQKIFRFLIFVILDVMHIELLQLYYV
jgi:hypothetical protein